MRVYDLRLTEFSQIVGKQLSKNSKICSNHFVDGKPTIEHPFPMLYLKDGAGSQSVTLHFVCSVHSIIGVVL